MTFWMREHWAYVLGGAAVAAGVGYLTLRPGDVRQSVSPPPGKEPMNIPPSNGPIKLTARLSDSFFRGVDQMASDFQGRGAHITAEDFLAVFLAESDCNPAIANSLGFAGLNQMGANERKAVGFTGSLKDYLALSAVDQLVYVRRFFEGNVRDFAHGSYAALTDYGRLYLMNFTPAYLLKPDDFVISKMGENIYKYNRQIDAANKGYINVADMGGFVRRRVASNQALWAELRARLNAVRGVV